MTCNLKNTNGLKHGFSGKPLYCLWVAMKQRCLNPKAQNFKNYGGRGISICDRWLSFENFVKDMLPTFQKGLTLDRINNDGNYEPNNCRWATHLEQGKNKQNSPPKELLDQLENIGLTWGNYKNRLYIGWSEHEARTIPKGVKRNHNRSKT